MPASKTGHRSGGTAPESGHDNLAMCVVTEALSKASLAVAGSPLTRPEIMARAIMAGGHDGQKARWLPICARGEGASLVRDGVTKLGGRLPVNPSGGLACFGEAVPAQALAQVCELTWQLRGESGDRQVEGAKVGITANQGLFGHGSSVIVKR